MLRLWLRLRPSPRASLAKALIGLEIFLTRIQNIAWNKDQLMETRFLWQNYRQKAPL